VTSTDEGPHSAAAVGFANAAITVVGDDELNMRQFSTSCGGIAIHCSVTGLLKSSTVDLYFTWAQGFMTDRR
jgi:hypothetical protein